MSILLVTTDAHSTNYGAKYVLNSFLRCKWMYWSFWYLSTTCHMLQYEWKLLLSVLRGVYWRWRYNCSGQLNFFSLWILSWNGGSLVFNICCFWLVDIDECLHTPNVCDTHANCTNVLGSYSCLCKSGYFGNGKNCTGKI